MEYLALDTETTGLDLHHGSRAFMINTLNDDGEYRHWEFPVDPFTREVQYDFASVAQICNYIFKKKLVFHHAKFDIRALSLMGIHVWSSAAEIHDTQLLSHVCNSQGVDGSHALKPLAHYYLDIPIEDQTNLRKAVVSARAKGKKLGWKLGVSLKGKNEVAADYWMPKALYDWRKNTKEKTLNQPTWKISDTWEHLCLDYANCDVYRTLGLFFYLREILEHDKLHKHYQRELDLLSVTYNMENAGMPINKGLLTSTLNDFKTKAKAKKTSAEALLCQVSGAEEVNSNSGQQLAAALAAAGFPTTKLTAKGQPSTDHESIIGLAQYCEHHSTPTSKLVAEALRHIQGYDPEVGDFDGDDEAKAIPGYKTYITGERYLKGYKALLDPLNRVHPSYNQVGTAWTRYASYEPNGQNIGKKAVLPLRRVFGPPDNYIWMAFDYSQLELRIFAAASHDANLQSAFDRGIDFHTNTAMGMYSLPQEKITSEQRRFAKNVNFGVIFGAGPAKIDYQTGQPGTYDTYMARFPDAKKFMRSTIARVENLGYVFTLSGYRLFVPQESPHKGVNAIVQGTAGDIVKYAMIAIHEKQLVDWASATPTLPYGGSSLIANIHDELLFQFPKSYPYLSIGRTIKRIMEKAGQDLGVNTPVEAKLITTNWAEGKKLSA